MFNVQPFLNVTLLHQSFPRGTSKDPLKVLALTFIVLDLFKINLDFQRVSFPSTVNGLLNRFLQDSFNLGSS